MGEKTESQKILKIYYIEFNDFRDSKFCDSVFSPWVSKQGFKVFISFLIFIPSGKLMK